MYNFNWFLFYLNDIYERDTSLHNGDGGDDGYSINDLSQSTFLTHTHQQSISIHALIDGSELWISNLETHFILVMAQNDGFLDQTMERRNVMFQKDEVIRVPVNGLKSFNSLLLEDADDAILDVYCSPKNLSNKCTNPYSCQLNDLSMF